MSPGAAAWRRPCAGAKSNSNALRKITQDAKPCRKLITGAISDGPELKRIQPRRRGHRMGGQRHRYLFSSSGCRGDPRDDGSCPGPTATGDPPSLPPATPPPPPPLRHTRYQIEGNNSHLSESDRCESFLRLHMRLFSARSITWRGGRPRGQPGPSPSRAVRGTGPRRRRCR